MFSSRVEVTGYEITKEELQSLLDQTGNTLPEGTRKIFSDVKTIWIAFPPKCTICGRDLSLESPFIRFSSFFDEEGLILVVSNLCLDCGESKTAMGKIHRAS